ncbi:MAG TPA: glucoamylase family protein [Chitinophagaceae bacterium]
MRIRRSILFTLIAICILSACSKKKDGGTTTPPPPPPANFLIKGWSVNGLPSRSLYHDISKNPVVRFSFSAPLNRSTVPGNIFLKEVSGSPVNFSITYENADSTIVLQPSQALSNLNKYIVSVTDQLRSPAGGKLSAGSEISFVTSIDSSRKFPVISDDELLTLVQRQTFKYFWDFAHPVSGLARERNTSGETVTSGGSGFGIMAIVVGVQRQFITRAEGLAQLQKITTFLKTTAQRFHGAFPHWLNGTTGQVIPFSSKDNGADLVETSYLIQGLLTARQFFNGADAAETALRNDINSIWNTVEWNWFRKNNENVLYWHWSPNYGWDMNHPIKGWNECLITYALAASSTTFGIPKVVYDQGWASGGGMANNNNYYNIPLPLGPAYGGPLFFAHYSFLGIDPVNLTDAYANYQVQNRNHTLINNAYVRANPKGFFGYSDSCWGLTASDVPSGYAASSPTSDIGVIAPTAALSSFPYTPAESMKALKFFYYVLGDKLWGQYGFVDAFSLHEPWFASSYLAIDQGPIIIMIENHRTGLLWNLFMSAPEVIDGMRALGFQGPRF